MPPHKLLKLMEADGLNEIENWGGANAGDFYQTGNELSPGSNPNSHRYDDSDSQVTVNDFSAAGEPMTADFILYTSNPPQVQIVSPNPGDTVSGQHRDPCHRQRRRGREQSADPDRRRTGDDEYEQH